MATEMKAKLVGPLAKVGQPTVGTTWPRGAKVETLVRTNGDGRYEAEVHLNGGVEEWQRERLPGTFPTSQDAQVALDAYVAERRRD